MPKMKTHKGMAKRIKITKNKKYMFDRSCNNHLLTNKGKSRTKDQYGKELSKADSKNMHRLLPYAA
jgi:large subunit ribosomal protein L35